AGPRACAPHPRRSLVKAAQESAAAPPPAARDSTVGRPSHAGAPSRPWLDSAASRASPADTPDAAKLRPISGSTSPPSTAPPPTPPPPPRTSIPSYSSPSVPICDLLRDRQLRGTFLFRAQGDILTSLQQQWRSSCGAALKFEQSTGAGIVLSRSTRRTDRFAAREASMNGWRYRWGLLGMIVLSL